MQAHFKNLLSYAKLLSKCGSYSMKKAADLQSLASGVLRVTLLSKIPQVNIKRNSLC